MRKRAIKFLLFAAAVMHLLGVPLVVFANEEPEEPERVRQAGEDRWVPSLAITAGVVFQSMRGNVNSEQYVTVDNPPDPPAPEWIPLEGYHQGKDIVSLPFVGGSLEIMTPALDIPTRPRFFLSGEILPSFASTRSLAISGDPGCIRGPEPGVPCTVDEIPEERERPFGEESANGQGSKTNATVDTMTYGASVGVSFPFRIGKRQVRLKPAFSWYSYAVSAEGTVSHATCDPTTSCSPYWVPNFFPPPDFIEMPGSLRFPSMLRGSTSRRFNGIGPGLDIEVDAARWGPLGASLFLGFRAYYILGDRDMSFDASHVYTEPGPFNGQETAARWNVEVNPWLFRAHVGLRIAWLGAAK